MKLIMELPEECSAGEAYTIISDALGEFVLHRGPTAEDYVERRYPLWSVEMRREKSKQVNRRIIHSIALLQSLRVVGE